MNKILHVRTCDVTLPGVDGESASMRVCEAMGNEFAEREEECDFECFWRLQVEMEKRKPSFIEL